MRRRDILTKKTTTKTKKPTPKKIAAKKPVKQTKKTPPKKKIVKTIPVKKPAKKQPIRAIPTPSATGTTKTSANLIKLIFSVLVK